MGQPHHHFEKRRYPSDLVLVSAAAFCYLVARACIQSVTIDEADSFMTFAAGAMGDSWYPASQNHLLNTLLERLSWSIFGFNQVAMRLPALLGAAIYLGSAVGICARFAGRVFRMLVFVCLVFNPFVLDYLVAARGYSLAVGFLLAAVAVFWWAIDREAEADPASLRRGALVSVLLALSFAANFSFAIADILAGVIFLLAAVIAEPGLSRRRIARIGISGTLPGAGVALFLCASVLFHWHSGELVYGAHSLREMWTSLFRASFPPPNPEIVNPLLYRIWAGMGFPLCVVAIIFLCAQVAAVVSMPRIWGATELRPTACIAIALGSIILLAVALHWAAFHAAGLLLPEARTGLFFAPLLTLLFAASADVLRRQPGLRRLSIPAVAILAVCSVYFSSGLRLHYFQQWWFNEDTKNVFWVMRDIEHRCGVHEFVTEWYYVATLNFYRRQYENETMIPFSSAHKDSLPKGKGAYVVYYPDDENFLKENGLSVWYHNWRTGAAVAVRACPERVVAHVGEQINSGGSVR